VAVNSLITIRGNGLAGSAVDSADAASYAASASYPWPLELGGTTVLISRAYPFGDYGTPIPLLYVSLNQINALVPAQFQPGSYYLTVKKGGGANGVVFAGLGLATVFPALFDNWVSGHYDAAALDARNSLISQSNPAVPGQVSTLFATGLGVWVGDNGLMRALVTPHVTVDGVPVAVSFAGRAPGYEGLDQINILLPPDLPRRHVSVPVTIEGQVLPWPGYLPASGFSYVSNTVMLAIQ
jgi:uncharacterized protein (TIGR03437 family)